MTITQDLADAEAGATMSTQFHVAVIPDDPAPSGFTLTLIGGADVEIYNNLESTPLFRASSSSISCDNPEPFFVSLGKLIVEE